MKPNASWPNEVFSRAHAEYPKAVAKAGLYATAFFGHVPPADAKQTTESVWRGLLRRTLRDYCSGRD